MFGNNVRFLEGGDAGGGDAGGAATAAALAADGAGGVFAIPEQYKDKPYMQGDNM